MYSVSMLLCMPVAKTLAKLRGCTDSTDPLLIPFNRLVLMGLFVSMGQTTIYIKWSQVEFSK